MFSISLKDTFIQFDTDRIEKYTVVEKGVFREYSLKWGFSDVQILDTGVRVILTVPPLCRTPPDGAWHHGTLTRHSARSARLRCLRESAYAI